MNPFKKVIPFLIVLITITFFSFDLNSNSVPDPYQKFINSPEYTIYTKYFRQIYFFIHRNDIPDLAQLSPDRD